MPNCTYCGAQLPSNARFCSNCGKVPATVQEQPPQMRVSPVQSTPPPLPPPTSASQSGEQQRDTPPSAAILPPGRQAQSPVGNVYSNTMHGNTIPPFKAARPSRLGSIPSRWLIIGLVAIIVVAGGLGILTAVVRAHLTGSTTSSSQNTPGLCSNQPLCTPPPNLKTPVIGRGASINLTLSGGVNGRLRAAKMTSCGVSGTQYNLLAQGNVGGTQYDLIFRITAYKGAGVYDAGQVFASLNRQPVDPTSTWINTGNAPATATIHNNTKTGTMNVTVSGAVNTVTITGSWRCA